MVAFSDIDRVHKRPDGTAKKNFQNNKKYFTKDEDYFELTRKELREKFSPNSEPIRGNPQLKTYLFTMDVRKAHSFRCGMDSTFYIAWCVCIYWQHT